MGLVKRSSEIIIIKHFVQGQAQSNHSMNVNNYLIIIVDSQESSGPHQ